MTEPLVEKRPWGRFTRYCHNETVTVKIIAVEPGGRLSLQRHFHRTETWVALDDGLVTEIDGETSRRTPGEPIEVPVGSWHRMSNDGDDVCRVLEIARGDFDEDDIERAQDDYGRG